MLLAARGSAIRKACEAASQTVAEVVPVVFGRRIDDPQKLAFGFGERRRMTAQSVGTGATTS